ncbi:MAG TPA: zf-HC2 domain-containing protein [Thermoanaerobaculia bacterium]
MRERKDRERVHRRVWELLPWHVNGTLSHQERERVEAHLAECLLCQEEERACRRTAAVVRETGDASPSPHPVQFQRLLARVEEHEREEAERRGRGRLARLLGDTPRFARRALLAQAAVILVLVGALIWMALPRPAEYVTLSDPSPPPVAGEQLRVMFAPGTTEREIRELLLAFRGEIRAGPSPLGVYTVEIPDGSDREVVLARLRSEPQVTFAQPDSSAAQDGR